MCLHKATACVYTRQLHVSTQGNCICLHKATAFVNKCRALMYRCTALVHMIYSSRSHGVQLSFTWCTALVHMVYSSHLSSRALSFVLINPRLVCTRPRLVCTRPRLVCTRPRILYINAELSCTSTGCTQGGTSRPHF